MFLYCLASQPKDIIWRDAIRCPIWKRRKYVTQVRLTLCTCKFLHLNIAMKSKKILLHMAQKKGRGRGTDGPAQMRPCQLRSNRYEDNNNGNNHDYMSKIQSS